MSCYGCVCLSCVAEGRRCGSSHRLWREQLVIPAYLAAVSALILVIQWLKSTKTVRNFLFKLHISSSAEAGPKVDSTNAPSPPQYTGLFAEAQQKIKQQGVAAFVLKIVRILACLALLAITIVAFVQDDEELEGKSFIEVLKGGWGNKHKRKKQRRRDYIHHEEWIEVTLVAFYVCIFTVSSGSFCFV